VKSALCNFCLKSGILCPSCQAKLRSGEISELELEIARILLSLEKTYPQLQNVTLEKAVTVNDYLAIVVGRGEVATFLSQGGKIIKDIRQKTGKRIRVLEQDVDDRKFLEDLFAPLSIMTINTIWLPDGTIDTRVIIRTGRQTLSKKNMNSLKEIAKKLQGMTLRVEFTR
jgi:transcription antitermination factor NusA-like protein